MEFAKAVNQELLSWKRTYMAALFEADKAKIAHRIDEAEAAVVLRTRELFQTSGDHQQERKALETALCALRALRIVTEHGTSPGRVEKLAS